MLYSGATPDVQSYLYGYMCQPTLTYDLECMAQSNTQINQLESLPSKLMKQKGRIIHSYCVH